MTWARTITPEDVRALARMAGFSIDPAYLPGVTTNLGLLLERAALLAAPPIEAPVEPAAAFRP